MQKLKPLGLIALTGLLIISLALNVFLYGAFNDHYRELNSVRLNPLGLNGVTPQVPDNESVVVFFGDSRVAQWSPAPKLTHATLVNLGIGAQTSAQVLGRFDLQVMPLKPKVILIQVGINDLKTIPLFPDRKQAVIEACKSNIREITDRARANGARVILTTVFPLGQIPIERKLFWSDDVGAAIHEVNDFIKTLAGDQVVIFDADSILTNVQGIVDARYRQDFLHLNAEGYAVLNQKLEPVLASQLSQP